MSLKITELAKGVQGYYVENKRFNTTNITFNLYLPLSAEKMAEQALLPYLLTSCCDKFRDYIELNLHLLELYGADLSCSATKCGDCFHIKLGICSINDSLSFDGSRPATEAAKLLCEMLFSPALSGESFPEEDLEREKRKTIERIEGEINNKRAFARTRLFEEMFGSDPYGKFSYGTVEEVGAITGEKMFAVWKDLLTTAFVRIVVVGDAFPEEVFSAVRTAFEGIDRQHITKTAVTRFPAEMTEPHTVTERFDVTQGKLAMGFSSRLHGSLREATAISVCTDIFGGGPYSKLFENVREKQSLCYYCSASARRSKGFVIVESGVEEKNADLAAAAVLKELDDMKNGRFDTEVIEASKRSIIDSLLGYYDNAAALDAWYSRNLDDENLSPEDAAELVRRVTKDDIIAAAEGIKLHTVYRLLPKGEDE